MDDLFGEFIKALTKVLNEWGDQLATATSEGAAELVRPVIVWMRETTNFVVYTPRDLVNALDPVLGLAQIEPLLHALAATAMLLAGGSYIGHRVFGWPGLDESVSRIGMTVVMVSSSWRLMSLSLDIFDGLASGLAARIPDVPGIDGLNPIVLAILLIVWAILLGLLMYAAGKRIAWMAILKAAILIGGVAWVFREAAWIPETFVKMWVGFLISQVLVILAMLVSANFVTVGGFGGYILSCACLAVARAAIEKFVPEGPTLSIPRIPGRR